MTCWLVTRNPLLSPLPPCYIPLTARRGPQHTSFNCSGTINSASDSLKSVLFSLSSRIAWVPTLKWHKKRLIEIRARFVRFSC